MRMILPLFAAMCMLGVCGGCANQVGTGGKRITVMTYNIHHGEGIDGKLDLKRIARIIREQRPDLVAVQEVDDRATRSGRVAQAAELGRLTRMNAVFGKAIDLQGGGYGQAILSRWPILEHEIHRLPQRVGRESRIVLTARIDSPGEDLMFASVHLDHQLEEVRKEQAGAMNQILQPETTSIPILLAGDFNAGPKSVTMQSLSGGWLDTAGQDGAFTIPAPSPRRRIDYILAAPKDAWRTLHSEVLGEAVASDHRPVVAQIEILR